MTGPKKIEGYVCPVCGYDLKIRWDDVLGYDYSWYGDCEHCDYHARFKPDQQKDIEEILGHHYFDNKHRYLDTSQKATKKEIALCLKEIKYWTRRLEVASDVGIREHVLIVDQRHGQLALGCFYWDRCTGMPRLLKSGQDL